MENNFFICGFGMALAEVQRLYGFTVKVKPIFQDADISYSDLVSAGLNSDDLFVLERVMI